MRSNRAEKSIVNMATGAILLAAIPVLGVLIAWPLWYLGTHHSALYSGLVTVVIIGLVLRGILQRR